MPPSRAKASATSLREQKKSETRRSILRCARRLFAKQGFDATTLDEICAGAQVSRRTFFRYFPTKEALVFPNRDTRIERFRKFMASPSSGATVFEKMRRVTRVFAAEYEQNRVGILAMQSIINDSAALLAREREIDREWEQVIEDAFAAERGNTPEARRRAIILAGATMGVVRATMRDWFAGGGEEDLAALGLAAIESLERGFP